MEKTPGTEFAAPQRTPPNIIQIETAKISQDEILQMVLKATPNVFLVLNPNRQIILANRALGDLLDVNPLEKLYGLRPGEALDCIHSTEHLSGCGTSKFCSTCGAIRAILTALDGIADVGECHIQQRHSGNTLEFRVFATPFTFESGQYIFVVLNDISS
ncbi:TPA: hypothetical protein DDW35_13640, partial [Candidatus Sumerlaeota bacterium]|nr:hypothetical protein [Candidatus Sumerlaeota bacterium]